MTRSEIYQVRERYFKEQYKYSRCPYKVYNYKTLNNVMYLKRAGQGHKGETYNDVIIMADTETSKETPGMQCKNYVVAWSISIRAFNANLVTLYGSKPSELVECINMIKSHFEGDKTIIYFHHLAYDWTFLRKFMLKEWGTPENQLNIKSHYPLFVNFANGLLFRDSLILAQRKLEKWAEDLNVEHKKAVGKWDYNKIRHQADIESLSSDELDYIEHDTLSGVECIQKTLDALNKKIYSMPFTATGIPRENVRELSKANRGRDWFLKCVLSYVQYKKAELMYHGGYTHGNRHILGQVIKMLVKCFDFVSCYPFQMLSKKYPAEKFGSLGKNVSVDYILKNADDYAFMFKLIIVKPHLKDDNISMPALQFSKCTKIINPVLDNGRVLCAEYLEIITNEVDLGIISKQYDLTHAAVVDVEFAKKDYLPRWFTDYIYEVFKEKCALKGGDPVLYSIAKAKLNALYGLCCQKPVKPKIDELYTNAFIDGVEWHNGEYKLNEEYDEEKEYEKYVKKFSSCLPYQIGCWVTSYAMASLFELGECCEYWWYSDTDSCYGSNWDEVKVEAYNEKCKVMLRANGYDAVKINGKEFWCGIAELDGEYEEFITVGAKRYACRKASDHKIKITVAGVPKKGAECLNNDLANFHKGFIFDGKTTGKLQHTYYYEDDIWIDENGNERGDSIDLSPASYELDIAGTFDWEKIFEEEIQMQVYEEGMYD